ncbi:hypothetical protein IH992_03785 [Candidatus Poribacteria bacterium]|nr:hypothetical protein [Candidatus Poribacteria bacterium]
MGETSLERNYQLVREIESMKQEQRIMAPEISIMKIYQWNPSGHGQYTFIVIDESEESAKARIDERVAQMRACGEGYECNGWSCAYELKVSEITEIILCENS